jgi:hypothetical protein
MFVPSAKPVAKAICLCDDVVSDPLTGKVSLLNLLDTVRVPVGRGFPIVLPKISVFSWLRDGRGKIGSHVDVVQGTSNKVIRRTQQYILNFEERGHALWARFKLLNLSFPAPGYYWVELFCEGDFMDDQVLHVVTD